MKTLEERVERIEEKLGIKNRTGYTWTIRLSDSKGSSFTYKIYNGRGNFSIQEIAELVADKLDGSLSLPTCNS